MEGGREGGKGWDGGFSREWPDKQWLIIGRERGREGGREGGRKREREGERERRRKGGSEGEREEGEEGGREGSQGSLVWLDNRMGHAVISQGHDRSNSRVQARMARQRR